MHASVFFQGGTLVLQHADEVKNVPVPFQFVKSRWRCEAYHYHAVLPLLREGGIRNDIPRWKHLNLNLHDTREPHDYQLAALDAWNRAGRRGSIILPTGGGKTFVAIHAISQVNASTVVIVPTIALVHQWYARLVNAFQTEVGVYYGSEKKIFSEHEDSGNKIIPIMVTTYQSAGDLISEYGNSFQMILYDEIQHLPARSWGESALMAPAPYRLGLTATSPEEQEQTNGRWRVDELLGPIVYTQRIESLVGKQLAEYRTQRIRVDLTEEERRRYDADHAIYMGFVRSRQLRQRYGAGWHRELMRLSASDPRARQAMLARKRLLDTVWSCE